MEEANMEIIILLVISWYLIGFCSCVYWWTKGGGFTVSDFKLAFFVSIAGPCVFIVEWGMNKWKTSWTR